MPVDPSISLNVTGGGAGPMNPGYAGNNPLALTEQMAGTASKLNELKLFNQTFAARKKFGQIMASSPDIASGIETATKDPDVSAFVPELAAHMANINNTILDSAGKIQGQGHDAFSNFVKAFPAVLQDPSQWDPAVETSLALSSPAIRPALKQSFENMRKGIFSNLDPDPAKAKEQMVQRLSGWAIANGAGDAIPKILGTPSQVDVGGVIRTGTVAPAQGGPGGAAPGEFTPGGNALTKSIAPQLATSAAVPYKDSGNRLGLPAPRVAGVAAAPVPEPTPDHGTVLSSFDHSPLFTSTTEMKAPAVAVRDIAGNPAGIAGDQARKLSDEFVGKGKEVYNSAFITKGQLAEMSHNFDTMAKNGGMMVPGSGADFRASLGKLATTIKGITGDDSSVKDVNDVLAKKVAAAEDLNKATQRMGINYLQTQLGSQREAAETIRNITEKGIPGIQNTYMGSKMLINMIGALNDRAIDQYEWQTEWLNRNPGDLRGADQAFNKAHPATAYIDKALEKLGMDQSGFTSNAAAHKALEDKLITKEQYDAIRKNKGKIPDNLPEAK